MIIFLTGEEDGVLGNDGDPGPKLAEPKDPDVDAVNLDGAARGLDDPEEGQGQRGLARPGPAHDPDLLHAPGLEVDPPEHQVQDQEAIATASATDVTRVPHCSCSRLPRLSANG